MSGDNYFGSIPVAIGGQQSSLGGNPTLSHNSGRSAVLWTTGNYGLRAYDPSQSGSIQPLFTGGLACAFSKFQNAVVANGYVYVAGDGCVTVFGLL